MKQLCSHMKTCWLFMQYCNWDAFQCQDDLFAHEQMNTFYPCMLTHANSFAVLNHTYWFFPRQLWLCATHNAVLHLRKGLQLCP